MKALFIFLIVLSSLSVNSQELCGFGTYDFISNTIKGIDKFPYSKVKYVDKTKPIKNRVQYVINYDRFGRVITIDSKGNGYSNENLIEGCKELDKAIYTYSDSIIPKEVKIKEVNEYQGTQEEYSFMFHYNTHNKTKSIDYTDNKGEIFSTYNFEYDKKNQLKSIDKDFGYYYEWDNKSRIKKITIPRPFASNDEYNFTYVDNRLATITCFSRLKDNKEIIRFGGTDVFIYINDKLDKVEYTDIKTGNSSYRLYNYDNEDKVIITFYDEQGIYECHYECYY
ncbi:hypothetical protein [Psychroserpens sp. NJDZ02]|uniref:hypothetical protein n=1 Tax=Psychroserpens sp. NJDZ02 TaxID=2570561 RepID=UPI0010A8E090|nr:hypothetical protein [Psychroserpens sp. NJDZ02]QCE43272.1 hypothetical protein E9099_18225 [Psychroserpens sp. NJDZ02]